MKKLVRSGDNLAGSVDRAVEITKILKTLVEPLAGTRSAGVEHSRHRDGRPRGKIGTAGEISLGRDFEVGRRVTGAPDGRKIR